MTVSTVPPDVVAAAAAAAGEWLRMPTGAADDRATLATLAACAMEVAEAFCGAVLIARAAEDVVTSSAAWRALSARPVATIGAVAGVAADGTALAVAADVYALDIDGDGIGWVRLTRPIEASRLRVGYVAGLAAGWDDLPAPIAQGVVMLVAHLFDQRDADAAPPAAVAALWRPWRRIALAAERRR